MNETNETNERLPNWNGVKIDWMQLRAIWNMPEAMCRAVFIIGLVSGLSKQPGKPSRRSSRGLYSYLFNLSGVDNLWRVFLGLHSL